MIFAALMYSGISCNSSISSRVYVIRGLRIIIFFESSSTVQRSNRYKYSRKAATPDLFSRIRRACQLLDSRDS